MPPCLSGADRASPLLLGTAIRRRGREMKRNLVVVAIVLSSTMCSGAADLKVQTHYPVQGNEGWDYISVDSVGRRIYVSHSVRVNVLDEDTGAQVGTIEDTAGVHGIAIDPKSKHGFTSNGKEDRVSM